MVYTHDDYQIQLLRERIEALEGEVNFLRKKIQDHEQYYHHITLSDVERWYNEVKGHEQ
jgi:hypothetical protein